MDPAKRSGSPASKKRTRTFSVVSDPSGASKRSRQRDQISSRRLRGFVTKETAIPSSLVSGPPNPIALPDLAASLGIDASRLTPLIERQYLKVMSPGVVQQPPPAAMEWLRTMFMPLSTRPFLNTLMVCDLLGCDVRDFRRLCLVHDIPLQDDPVFGELMSLAAFHRFFTALYHFRDPSRFDRQAMLVMLHAAYAGPDKAMRMLPFDRRLEMEIRRISKLPEPMRLERAMALREAYSEARDVAECLARYDEQQVPSLAPMEQLDEVIARSVGLSSQESDPLRPPESASESRLSQRRLVIRAT